MCEVAHNASLTTGRHLRPPKLAPLAELRLDCVDRFQPNRDPSRHQLASAVPHVRQDAREFQSLALERRLLRLVIRRVPSIYHCRHSSRTCWIITLRSNTCSSLNVPSVVLKPQAMPSSDIALFGQRNVYHLEVPTICRAECSNRNVARAGSSELPIPFQSALYAASPVAVRTFLSAAASDSAAAVVMSVAPSVKSATSPSSESTSQCSRRSKVGEIPSTNSHLPLLPRMRVVGACHPIDSSPTAV